MNEEFDIQFPKTRKRDLTGLVIGIPYCSDKMVPGAVLWQSKYFTNVILIAIFDKTMSFTDSDTTLGTPLSMIYTAAQIIRQGRWKILGDSQTDYPIEISTRRVAVDIFIDDEPVRRATDEDYSRYPNMQVAGCAAVERYIRGFLGLENPGKLDEKIRAGMEYLLSQYLKE